MRAYDRADGGAPSNDFAECILRLRPTAIVGVSTAEQAFAWSEGRDSVYAPPKTTPNVRRKSGPL